MVDAAQILLSEKNISTGKEYFYVQPSAQDVLKEVSLGSSKNIKDGLKNIFKEIFLPQGYPASVSDDYISYQIWDTAQAFCSTITGILATQSVMKGVGVGDTEATPLAATITWVLKDGTGHIGRIGFAWWKGTSLDADSKKWRLVADGLNDMAICLELALPIFEGYVTYVLCLTTAMKAIVGVAGGATRAALTQHQAIRGNLADVSAKDGSQETAVNLCASMIAILIISYIQKNLWFVFMIFTVLHLISNYFAVSSVCLKIFNRERYINILHEHFKKNVCLEPNIVNKNETVIFGRQIKEKDLFGCDIIMGHSIKKIVSTKRVGLRELNDAIKIFQNSYYMLLMDIRKEFISVIFDEAAKAEDVLKSYYHAAKMGRHIISRNNENISIDDLLMLKEDVDLNWEFFSEDMKAAGWNLSNQLILYQEWQVIWNSGLLQQKLSVN